jgi:hypothetical protein
MRQGRRGRWSIAALVLAGALGILGSIPTALAGALAVQLDSASVVRLKKDAATVIVGNPNIAEVSVESPTLIFVFGIRPGETSLTIMDKDGETLLATPVVVTPPAVRAVTVDRNVVEFTYTCDPRCAQTRTPGEDKVKPAKSVGGTVASAAAPEDLAAAAGQLGAEGSGQLLLQPAPTSEE